MTNYKIAINCTKAELKTIQQNRPDTAYRAELLLSSPPWQHPGPFVPDGLEQDRLYYSSEAVKFIFNDKHHRWGVTRQTVLFLITRGELAATKNKDRWLIKGRDIEQLNRKRLLFNPLPPKGSKQREINLRCTEQEIKIILEKHTPRGRALWLLK